MRPAATSVPSPFSQALRLLAERRYSAAWPLWEARREFMRPRITCPVVEYPEWSGGDPSGMRIMVVVEQGFGDQMMFARYVPRLRELGAHVTVACHPVLSRLFRVIADDWTPFYVNQPLPPADAWTFIGSLPLRLGIAAPLPAQYIGLSAPKIGGVGVATRGSLTHPNDANRSLPPESAADLLQMGGSILPEDTGAQDFIETAVLIAKLDLVVTVDTSVAHLAGAMGVPVWVLLPDAGLDWRWNDGIRSDWYPDARLFRQHPTEGWRRTIGDVRAALSAQ
ncbi:glycosyltransferase family 9 protein [Phenylobacterium deserti]|nr:glycosyltransferase family 9 protein [Phenylobacterium deserti]